ncbi:MAG: glycosyltransferase [Bacillaceae bacterium]
MLISSFDMEVGGVERSLINLLSSLDYDSYKVDLMLYRHIGDFFDLLPKQPTLLQEVPQYATFRKGIKEIVKEGYWKIALARLRAKYVGDKIAKQKGYTEFGLIPMQYMWKYANPYLPKIEKEYDVAISFLWPHYFVANKVKAKKKIAWIHTDYSYLQIDNEEDERIWEQYNHIVAVSESCKESFLKQYPQLREKVIVIENISTPSFIKEMAEEEGATELKENDGYTKLLTIARLSYAKGIDDAILACKKLVDSGYKIKWYIVGYGAEEASLKALIKQLNLEENFILLGKRINPYPYLKYSDIYVQPSRYEGKAVTVTEAQIMGKAVVITNYNTAPSQVEHGVDGIICGKGVDDIVSGIKQIMDNPSLKEQLERNIANKDYWNKGELDKLYELV